MFKRKLLKDQFEFLTIQNITFNHKLDKSRDLLELFKDQFTKAILIVMKDVQIQVMVVEADIQEFREIDASIIIVVDKFMFQETQELFLIQLDMHIIDDLIFDLILTKFI